MNPGSVGLPFEQYGLAGQVKLLPAAQYALVSWDRGCWDVELRSVPVDVNEIVVRPVGQR